MFKSGKYAKRDADIRGVCIVCLLFNVEENVILWLHADWKQMQVHLFPVCVAIVSPYVNISCDRKKEFFFLAIFEMNFICNCLKFTKRTHFQVWAWESR